MTGPIGLPVRRLPWPMSADATAAAQVTREWLVTNGLGGYASGTVAGVMTRRYHGLLIAALPAPHGRTVMLSHLSAQVRWPDGRRRELGGREWVGADADVVGRLVEFRLEGGLPVWRYQVDGVTLERRLLFSHLQNTVHVIFELIEGGPIELALRPSVNFRAQEAPVSEPLRRGYQFDAIEDRYAITLPSSGLPPLRMLLRARDATFTLKTTRIDSVLYPVEESRGYHAHGDLWSPGYYRCALATGERAGFVASTESFETMAVLGPVEAHRLEIYRRQRLLAQAAPEARHGTAAELVLAADQFIITPAGRFQDATRARAAGDAVRTVIAGYHWFTDWGRDTMISLEGLTLATGRHGDAGEILRTFAHYVRDGLIPNMFPEGENDGLYHTADATLWFFHAVARYVSLSHDELTLSTLYPTLKVIVDAHVRGTRFGIRLDPDDGLLTQGADGYQLTWMDAKVDDWVVTPRRGKAVEINALWFNALRLMADWAGQAGDPDAGVYRTRAQTAQESFNRKFWCAAREHLYDVIDGEPATSGATNDARCRPNQLLAIALPHAVLAPDRWPAVMRAVRTHLLTPVGLRSLAPGEPEFKSRYYGDLRARDAAYHQGTVWGWLAGPFVDAWLKVYPDDVEGARRALAGFEAHLDDACVGSVSEVFDADAPFTPRGCVAQAWSVAELLRVLVALERRTAEPWRPVRDPADRGASG